MKQNKSKEKLLEQLEALKLFPKNKLASQLRKQIQTKLQKLERPKTIKPKKKNQTRSGKLRRYHNYIRQIRNNFPNLSYNQIRSQLKKRKEGQDVSIPDVIWQNPSP
jgi:uncharacterized protein YpbB